MVILQLFFSDDTRDYKCLNAFGNDVHEVLCSTEERLPCPAFRSYEELEEILQTCATIYEEVKQALLEITP